MKKYKCLCCGFYTLDERGAYDICPVCFWEDERYLYKKGDIITTLLKDKDMEQDAHDGEKILDIKSGANHGLTLRQGRENYKRFGACEESMVSHVRKPYESEMDGRQLGGGEADGI